MAERTESQGFYEMLWDCDHCDTKALLANSQRHCAGCGAPQNPDKRYFPKEGEEKKVDGHRFEGSDRHCPACNTPMGASAKNCTKCGSPLDGSKEVKGVAAPVKAAPRKKYIWPWVLGVLIAFGLIVWFFLRTKDAKLTIAGHKWERSIAIEKYGDYPEEAWRDEIPKDAGAPTCAKKERSKKQVPDGEDCTMENVDKKDGTFEKVKKCTPKFKEEPVEDDWCTFTMRRWQKVDEVKASGTGLNATWPTNAPAADTKAMIDAKRSGAKTETLELDFGKAGTCKVDEATWRKYADGQKVKVEVRARSGAVVCTSL